MCYALVWLMGMVLAVQMPEAHSSVNTEAYQFWIPSRAVSGVKFRTANDPDAEWLTMPEIVLPKPPKKVVRVVAGPWLQHGLAVAVRYIDRTGDERLALAVTSKRKDWAVGEIVLGKDVSPTDVRVLTVENDVAEDGDTIAIVFMHNSPRFGKLYLYRHDCPSIIQVASGARWDEYRASRE